MNLIVAYDEDRCIGKDNKIPWRFPDDMKHFKETTMGHNVIMGRKTWDSLPDGFKPLPGRVNIVLSRSQQFKDDIYRIESVCVSQSLEEALNIGDRYSFIIGGGEIYRSALDAGIVDKVIASEVRGRHDGDTFFPVLPGWNGTKVKECEGFDIVEYVR